MRLLEALFFPTLEIPSYEEFAENERRNRMPKIERAWLEREEYQTKRNAELAESWKVRLKVLS